MKFDLSRELFVEFSLRLISGELVGHGCAEVGSSSVPVEGAGGEVLALLSALLLLAKPRWKCGADQLLGQHLLFGDVRRLFFLVCVQDRLCALVESHQSE